jgi:hypothetical protein
LLEETIKLEKFIVTRLSGESLGSVGSGVKFL